MWAQVAAGSSVSLSFTPIMAAPERNGAFNVTLLSLPLGMNLYETCDNGNRILDKCFHKIIQVSCQHM